MKNAVLMVFSVVMALIAMQWMVLPSYDDTADGKSVPHRVSEFITATGYNLGYFLEWAGLATRVEVLRFTYGTILGSLNQYQPDPELQNERKTIEGVSVLIHTPKGLSKPSTGIVFYHGGAWIFGSADGHAAFSSWLAKTTQSVVISVDYRLCPEIDYEQQYDEILRVTRHVLGHASNFKVDPRKIFVAGDSAGGTMAASISLEFPEKLVGAVLLGPPLQSVNFSLPSLRLNRHYFHSPPELYETLRVAEKFTPGIQRAMFDGDHVPKEMLEKFNRELFDLSTIPNYEIPKKSVRNYRPPEKSALSVNEQKSLEKILKLSLDVRAHSFMASDEQLRRLPATFIQISELDFMRDEELLYAYRLKRLGVPVTISYLEDATHIEPVVAKFMPPPHSAPAQKGLNDIVEFIKTKQN